MPDDRNVVNISKPAVGPALMWSIAGSVSRQWDTDIGRLLRAPQGETCLLREERGAEVLVWGWGLRNLNPNQRPAIPQELPGNTSAGLETRDLGKGGTTLRVAH